jgi:uncharacterized protein with beta-barrel porin domain
MMPDSATSPRSVLRRISAALLTGSAVLVLAATPAMADGGVGGDGFSGGSLFPGAAGGWGFGGMAGGDFNSIGPNGGAGGGGAGGGVGGSGFDGTNPVAGGAGGTAGSINGVDGTSSVAGSGGGGGYHGATAFGGNVAGGSGGRGGDSSDPDYGGAGGGAGGYGVVITTGGTFSNSGIVAGGTGGAGGAGGVNAGGGSGGDGGVGVYFAVAGVTFTNSGTIVGGAGGLSAPGAFMEGRQGAGVASGDSLTVVNTATGMITGGDAIFAESGDLTVSNAGIINGTTSAVNALNGVATVSNTGTITGDILGQTGVTLNNAAGATISGFTGVMGNSGLVDVTNAGTITGRFGGVYSGGDLKLVNSGSIAATDGLGVGVGAAGDANVVNQAGGVISGAGEGILSATATVVNAGVIAAGTIAIYTWDVANVTNSGTISGVTAISVLTDGSTVFNSGTITGSGGTAIQFTGSNNTLTLAPGSVINGVVQSDAGGNIFQLGGSGAATFDIAALDDTAQYRNFGTLNKVGSSIWTVTGTSTFTGDVNVNAGTLVVNGNLSSASLMFVNPGGTLSGTGTVPFTLLDNGATLAPGPLSGTGTLTINDHLVFCDCSIYAVKISGTGNDMARVVAGSSGTGDAFLDGPVQVTSPTKSYRFNSPYTILTTAGGLNGTTFSSLTLPSGIIGVLSYTDNDVLLTLTSGLSQTSGLNQNQRAVANALDTAFNAGVPTGGLGAMFSGNVPQNLTQASGELGTGVQQTTFDAMSQFMGVLTDPFLVGRGGAAGAPGAPAFAAEGDEPSAYAGRRPMREAQVVINKALPSRTASFEQRWSVWGAAYGGSQKTDGNAVVGSNATTSRIAGVGVGADYRISPDTVAGFALFGGGTSFDVANGLGNGRSDLVQAGAFVRHHVGAAYLTAALAYGWQDIETNRTVTVGGFDQLRAHFEAGALSGRAEAGYRFTPWLGTGVTPYVAGQFVSVFLPSYAEQALVGSNAFALTNAAKDVTTGRSELGLRADTSWMLDRSVLTLRGRAAWAHNVTTDRAIAATFQTLPGASFVVNGAAQAREAALVSGAVEMKWLNGFSLAASFEGEFSDVTRSYAGKGIARYQW